MRPVRASSVAEPVLVLHRVSRWIRAGVPGCAAAVQILVDVDLVVHRGERVGVIGAPGTGKTTLLLVACGLLLPDRGTVWALEGAALCTGRAPRTGRTIAEAVAPLVPSRVDESVYWSGDGEAALVVARSAGLLARRVDRLFRLEHARLRATPRVDSHFGPP